MNNVVNKAVIMSGGLGTRLKSLTDGVLNKHLCDIYDKKMIMHVVDTLVQGGITDIMLVQNGPHPGLFEEFLGTGKNFGCDIYYRNEREIGGPGRSLALAEKFVGNEDFVAILGDSMYFHPLNFLTGKKSPYMHVMSLRGQNGEWFDDPQKYVQITLEGDVVKGFVKKPKELFSELIQTQCWVLPGNDVFSRIHKLNKEKKEGEVEFSDFISQYVEEGKMGYITIPPESFIDCGTHDALLKAAMKRQRIVKGLE